MKGVPLREMELWLKVMKVSMTSPYVRVYVKKDGEVVRTFEITLN